jgi:hypothetical protein
VGLQRGHGQPGRPFFAAADHLLSGISSLSIDPLLSFVKMKKGENNLYWV